jgi:hypothetical protein
MGTSHEIGVFVPAGRGVENNRPWRETRGYSQDLLVEIVDLGMELSGQRVGEPAGFEDGKACCCLFKVFGPFRLGQLK